MLQIRLEEFADALAVREVHTAAFGADGAHVADLVDALRPTATGPAGLSLVAETPESCVVGHVMFTPSLLDAPSRLVPVLVLSPLGVAPAHQLQGIGGALVQHGLEMLATRDVPLVFLEGSPRYYPRLGFRQGEPLGFRKPSLRIPDAAFQVFTLPAYQPWMSGTLVYSQTFWDLDAVGLRDSS